MHTTVEHELEAASLDEDSVSVTSVCPASAADEYAVPGFDAVAHLAAASLDVAMVSLVLDSGGAYWYSRDPDSRRPHALHPLYLEAARRGAGQVLPDIAADARYRDTPPLTGPLPAALRFFACEPVFTLNGRHVGALCVMDHAPRAGLDEAGREALRNAARLAGAGVVLGGYLGRTDPVTQLPHRSAFFEDLRARHKNGAQQARLIAIEVAPVERFNAFVRAMGFPYADELMRAVAARVQTWMPLDTHLYQVGATRFAAVLPEADRPLDDCQLDDLVSRLRAPFDCLDIPLTLQPGVGLLDLDVRRLDGTDPLRQVMSASHAAQRHPRGWALYERSQDERHRQEFFLVTELAAALTERTELYLQYQPRVRLSDGHCVAMEALARWRHPTLGEVAPGQFVPLAERAGLMRALTGWVLDRGVAQLAAWRREGYDIGLSINISNADFDADLVTRLQAVSSRHGVDPRALELEFTESTLLAHNDATSRHLAAVRELGAGIAIDDFGTGYSNLASLRQMPATCLKIDQSFVRAMDASPHDAAIVRSTAALAHDLGFRVVVEGVENRRIYDIVHRMACDEVQGFHVSRPLPAAAVPAWLDRAADGYHGGSGG
ncbi:putative bifunctional diguanylate cyclase/phosphodiesterase [Frateuria hangzhouensis]|uniref:putative bifunctional diguanylate cyclase/phosphodiesterase n=1 Tax=Frateuria hangzhouensis TaxID=2995589 RepID=UPI002260DDFB|nr:GGDEF domain-containing phosphodiesterase [Frateuria sp. STR12]MCX7513184.1 GGDEF domain-containing phosphodiesterase [Frateuria sp. STR12]